MKHQVFMTKNFWEGGEIVVAIHIHMSQEAKFNLCRIYIRVCWQSYRNVSHHYHDLNM